MSRIDKFLLDPANDPENIKKIRGIELLAKIALKYGKDQCRNITITQIKEFWKYKENYPSQPYLDQNIKASEVKWFIHNYLQLNEEIWNSDFLRGLSENGVITDKVPSYPVLKWTCNDGLSRVVSIAPYPGNKNTNNGQDKRNSYGCVPALVLKYNKDSISYLAGLLSAGEVRVIKGYSYAAYCQKLVKRFQELCIPLERPIIKVFGSGNVKTYISPIWPALFSYKMPKELGDMWINVKKPIKADIYCPILWRTYVSRKYMITAGIPHLKCARSLFYQAEDTGGMRKFDMLRVELNLVGLDYRIKEAVQWWKNQYLKAHPENKYRWQREENYWKNG